MNDQITKSWGYPTAYRGVFDNFIVHGAKYVAEDGEVAWHTTSWPGENPTHDFWVVNGQFHLASFHYLHQLTNDTRIEAYGVVDVEPEEKAAILQALAEWTSD
jgi:hypothetical protein